MQSGMYHPKKGVLKLGMYPSAPPPFYNTVREACPPCNTVAYEYFGMAIIILQYIFHKIRSTGYIKNKGFDDKYYKDLIVEYLKQYGKAKKKDIRKLLWEKLPDSLSDNQKENKIHNLLAALKRAEIIENDGINQQTSFWILRNLG